MNKINAVIIEDEIPAARLLSSMIKNIRPGWNIEILQGNIEYAVDWFANNPHPDLIFLDIQLSDGNSFIFIDRAKPKSTIIFTTAYDEYAVKAFRVNSIDYLLKPINKERLEEAIVKYETLSNRNDDYLNVIMDCLTPKEKRFRTRFLISGIDKLWTLEVSEISYLYSENKITYAVTQQGAQHMIDLTLDKLSEQLDPDQFFRANRQTIISIKSIVKIEPYFGGKVVVVVHPPSKEKITISREKITQFKMWLNY